MERHKRGAFLVGAGFLVVLAIIAGIYFLFNSDEPKPMLVSQDQSVCEIDPLVHEIGVNIMTLNDDAQLFKPIAEKIQSADGYLQSLSCLGILTRFAIVSGSLEGAQNFANQLESLHSQAGDFDSKIIGNINKAYLDELKTQITVLADNAASFKQQRGYFGIPKDLE